MCIYILHTGCNMWLSQRTRNAAGELIAQVQTVKSAIAPPGDGYALPCATKSIELDAHRKIQIQIQEFYVAKPTTWVARTI